MRHTLALSALALALAPVLAACATSSGPAPLVIGGASSAATEATAVQKIGQCDPAFPDALIDYPRGWNDRLARVEETATPNAEDELLGGAAPSRSAGVSDRDAQPVRPPIPRYPQAALDQKKEGTCRALFDVTAKGMPTNILVACSDPVFAQETRTAMQQLTFTPRMERGEAIPRRNVIYPLTFCFE